MTEADLADNAKRIVVDSTLFATTGAAAIARQEKSTIITTTTTPGFTPWQQVVLSRVSGPGTAIAVEVWALWKEEV